MLSNDRQEYRVIVILKKISRQDFVLAMIDDTVNIGKYNHNTGCVCDGLDWLGSKIDNVTASLFVPKKRLGRR